MHRFALARKLRDSDATGYDRKKEESEIGKDWIAMNTTVLAQTVGLLALSNVFMTFAWYAHLKELSAKPWFIAALVSWGVALFEYLLQVPANRIGFTQFSLAQLKIIQEAITLVVFVPFALFYMNQPLKLDYLWASLCIMGAVYFIFRG
jgi:uncharacterized protein (DUF486 family)